MLKFGIPWMPINEACGLAWQVIDLFIGLVDVILVEAKMSEANL